MGLAPPACRPTMTIKTSNAVPKREQERTKVTAMAFFGRVGNLLRQAANKQISSQLRSSPSVFQAIRCLSSAPNSRLFVGGVSYSTDESSLREAFSKYGTVVDARVIVDRETGRSRGFGFVTFTSVEEASSAIQALDQKDLHGRIVRVNYANERPRGFGGGFGNEPHGSGAGFGGAYGNAPYGGSGSGGGYGDSTYGGNAAGGYGGGGYGAGSYGSSGNYGSGGSGNNYADSFGSGSTDGSYGGSGSGSGYGDSGAYGGNAAGGYGSGGYGAGSYGSGGNYGSSGSGNKYAADSFGSGSAGGSYSGRGVNYGNDGNFAGGNTGGYGGSSGNFGVAGGGGGSDDHGSAPGFGGAAGEGSIAGFGSSDNSGNSGGLGGSDSYSSAGSGGDSAFSGFHGSEGLGYGTSGQLDSKEGDNLGEDTEDYGKPLEGNYKDDGDEASDFARRA
ncbi:hypothetical protein L6164_011248 [Bauhinia variegata]|uniref:Uncharacterized protein n=1 Tax=Bauhinia variegata TaxID=167791 RepID=A0ACB9P588_BAUVA|nr:hypothetical protein L6164_011248 [Bauhinia variegata]